MPKPTTVREQRTMFHPCAACDAPIAFGFTLVGVPSRMRVGVGIALAQARRLTTCCCCRALPGVFHKPRTIAEAIRDFSITRPVRLAGAA